MEKNKGTKPFRSGFVALLGRPNVGKSSIINALLKEHVAAVSPKPQTTRNAVRCILSGDTGQIIFVDTPGVHKPQHELGRFMLKEITDALSQVDAICFVVEAGDRSVGQKEKIILAALAESRLPIVLAVNKIDKYPTEDYYLGAAAAYSEVLHPAAVVPVSAVSGKNLELLTEKLEELLPEQPPIYPEDMLMDSTERFLAAEVIREKIFLATEEEVPHGVAVVVEEFRSPDEYPELRVCEIRANIIVERPGQKGIIIGKNGAKLKEIGSAARKDLEERFGYPVYLQLWVKIKPNWKKSQDELRRLGYSF